MAYMYKNNVFFYIEIIFENKIIREMLCFTIEMAVGGCEGRRYETAITAMVAYILLWSDRCSIGK